MIEAADRIALFASSEHARIVLSVRTTGESGGKEPLKSLPLVAVNNSVDYFLL